MHGARMLLDEILEPGVALGEPGPFVQKPRRVQEGSKIDFDHRTAERFDSRGRLVEQASIFTVAKELQLLAPRYAESPIVDGGVADPARIRIVGVKSFDHRKNLRRILARQCKYRHAVQ